LIEEFELVRLFRSKTPFIDVVFIELRNFLPLKGRERLAASTT
jgi:hypothetical protein